MTFWTQLDEVCDRWDVSGHPFHKRFTTGACGPRDLTLFASQIGAPAGGLAIAADNARRRVTAVNRDAAVQLVFEYREQALLWKGFERAVGVKRAAELLVETEDVVDALSEEPKRGAAASLAVVCAVERTRPPHHAALLVALDRFYGLHLDDDGIAYFRTVVDRAQDCEQISRSLLEPLLEEADHSLLLANAEAALSAYWELYDALERGAAGSKPEPSRVVCFAEHVS